MPNISLISSDPSSFLSNVPGAVLTRIDGKDYLFVDPSNNYNLFWYNASDLMVTPPAPKFDVTTLSGLQNWYDASDPLATGTLPSVGTAIQTWTDKADTKNSATAANGYGPVPTFQNDGKPFIDFKDTFYNIKNPWQWMAGSYYTVFIVAGTGVGRDGNRYVILLGGGEEGTYMIGQDAAWFRMPSRNFREFPISSRDKNIVLNNNSGATPELYAVSYRDDEIHIRLTGAQVVKRDGNNLIHKQKLSSNATDPVSVIGTKGNGNWVRYTGRYREILAFKGPMAESDVQKVEGYLAWKWGLNKTLPNNHPYFAKSP
jgi:hypothetical protein